MNFFAEEVFCDESEEIETEPRAETSITLKDQPASSFTVEVREVGEEEEGEEDPVDCFEFIHSRIAPSRRLNDLFFQEDIMVNIFTLYIWA